MLSRIRDVASGWIAYVIVGLLAIPFALWGVQSYFGTLASVVMEVGEVEVDVNEFNQALLERKRYLQSVAPDADLPPDSKIKSDTISVLAIQAMIKEATERYDYQVSDRFLAHVITQTPEFLNEVGQFDDNKYQAYLKAEQISRVKYENRLREQMKRDQLFQTLDSSGFILETEQTQFDKLYNEERKVRYLEVDTEHYLDSVSVTDEEVKQRYDNNPQNYQSELEFRLRYAEIKIADLMDLQEVDEGLAQIFYEENIDLFIEPEKRLLRHILFDPTAHDEDVLKERIAQVRKELAAGKSFEELAKTYSDDFLTAKDGGALPQMSEFDIEDDTIRETVFTLSEGEVSEPLESQFGIQMFELVEITPEVEKTFDEVSEKVIENIKLENAQDEYARRYERVEQIAYVSHKEVFDNLLSTRMAIPSTVTEWLRRDSREGIFADPTVRRITFDKLFTDELSNSGVVELVEGSHAIVFALNDANLPKQQTFEEVAEEIRDGLLMDKAENSAIQDRNKWLGQIKKGEKTVGQIAKSKSVTLHDLDYIRRDAQPDGVPPTVVSSAFDVVFAEGGEPVYLPTRIERDYAIVEISNIRQDKDADSRPISFSLREQNAILESLTGVFKIEIFEDNIPE